MKLRIRARARQDIDAILEYGVTEHGEEVAEAYVRTIGAALDRLADYPELGLSQADLAAGLRSYPVGEHRVFYVLRDGWISIVRVLHKSMDARRHL